MKSVFGITSTWWHRTTPMTTWPPRPWTLSTQRAWTLTRECAVLFVSQVCAVMIHIALHGSRVLRMSSHPRMWGAYLSDLRSSILLIFLIFPFISYLLHYLPHFFHFLEGRSEPVHSAKKGYGLSWRDPLPHRSWAQRLLPQGYLRRVLHRVSDFPAVLQARVSRGRRVRWHRTRGYASRSTPSTCLSLPARRLVCRSVCRRRLCPKERGDLLESERGDLLKQLVRSKSLQMHRLELCWTDRKSKSSPKVGRKFRNTTSRLIVTEKVYENFVKLLNLIKKNFTALKLKNYNDEINNFFMNCYCSKLRNHVKLISTVSMKWKNSRRFRVPLSTLLQDED